jgi:hypothetical protein
MQASPFAHAVLPLFPDRAVGIFTDHLSYLFVWTANEVAYVSGYFRISTDGHAFLDAFFPCRVLLQYLVLRYALRAEFPKVTDPREVQPRLEQ